MLIFVDFISHCEENFIYYVSMMPMKTNIKITHHRTRCHQDHFIVIMIEV